MRFKFPRETFIPKGFVKIADKLSDAVAYVGENRNGKPRAVVFFGKQSNPVSDVWYRDDDRRRAHVTQMFEGRRAHLKRTAESRASRVAFVHDYKVGDIFHTSWGYDQTNVEFFQCVEVKGKYLILREIGQSTEATCPDQWRTTPVKDSFLKPRFEGDDRGLPIRRLAQQGGVKIDDVRTAWPVKPKIVEGREVYESHYASTGH